MKLTALVLALAAFAGIELSPLSAAISGPIELALIGAGIAVAGYLAVVMLWSEPSEPREPVTRGRPLPLRRR